MLIRKLLVIESHWKLLDTDISVEKFEKLNLIKNLILIPS